MTDMVGRRVEILKGLNNIIYALLPKGHFTYASFFKLKKNKTNEGVQHDVLT